MNQSLIKSNYTNDEIYRFNIIKRERRHEEMIQKEKLKKQQHDKFLSTGSSPMCKENYANIRGSRLRDSHKATVVRPVISYYTFVPYLLYRGGARMQL